MLSKIVKLIQKYNPNKILIDGANPSFIRSLKIQLNENPDYDKIIARYKNMKVNWQSFSMKVLPINFNQEHKTMLSHCKMYHGPLPPFILAPPYAFLLRDIFLLTSARAALLCSWKQLYKVRNI